MKKIKLVQTRVLIYEPYKDWYPEGMSIEEMAEMDMRHVNHEDSIVFNDEIGEFEDMISYEIIEVEDAKESNDPS